MEWHVHIDGNQSGPHPGSVAVAWAKSGQLRPIDLVWSDGMTDWVPAGQAQPFVGVFVEKLVAASVPRRLGDDATMRAILPVGRSGWAIAAGYLGLFSVLFVPAPFALLTGIIAIVDIKRNEHKHGMGRAIFGIIMGALFTVTLIVLLAKAGR